MKSRIARLSPRQRAVLLQRLAPTKYPAPPADAGQQVVTGPVLIPPPLYALLPPDNPSPFPAPLVRLYDVPHDLAPAVVQEAMRQVLLHHDALRMHFVHTDTGWQGLIAQADAQAPFAWRDLSTLPPAEQDTIIRQTAAELSASLRVSEGPLVRVVLFHRGEHLPGRLLLVISHFVIDGPSWTIVEEDIATACRKLSRGEAVRLPAKTTSFRHWAERVTTYARSAVLREELDYWLGLPWAQVVRLPVDYPEGRQANTWASLRFKTASLSVEDTRALLREVPRTTGARVNEVLLAALAHTFRSWAGRGHVLVTLVGHGREPLFDDVDLSRTVGFLTVHRPVLVDTGRATAPRAVLSEVKEQLQGCPHNGRGYELLRDLSEDAAITTRLQALPRAEMALNYLGQGMTRLETSSLLRPLRSVDVRALVCPMRDRPLLLDIEAAVIEGQLQVCWEYSDNLHRSTTVVRVVQGFMDALRVLIRHA